MILFAVVSGCGRSQEQPAAELSEIAQARQWIREGRYAEARELYQQLLVKEPSAAVLWADLAYIHVQQGNRESAVRAATKAVELDPHLAEAYATLGLALHQPGQEDARAIEALDAAVRLNPSLAQARVSLGYIYFQRGELDLALRELRTAVGLDAAIPEANFNLALVYDRIAARKGARGNVERAEARRYYVAFLALNAGPQNLREYARDAVTRLGDELQLDAGVR